MGILLSAFFCFMATLALLTVAGRASIYLHQRVVEIGQLLHISFANLLLITAERQFSFGSSRLHFSPEQ
jgi:hypothetical protein